MSQLIQVGNLPDFVDSAVLRRLFEVHGAVRSSRINRHIGTGRSTGVGFIEMESQESAEAAIAAMNHVEQYGRMLSVCWSNSPNPIGAGQDQKFGSMNTAHGYMIERQSNRR
jgi:RNA recognition motif-containing protein